uniref:EF-hand domain-containing protein n=1 Tax=Acrobeloides nanus TaxID=290746 RepID=A0A914BW68_9BILA
MSSFFSLARFVYLSRCRPDPVSFHLITYAHLEYLLSDRPYIETQSRQFHDLDLNDDGKVAREEFEQFYRNRHFGRFTLISILSDWNAVVFLNFDLLVDAFLLDNVMVILVVVGTGLFDDGNSPPIMFNLPQQLFHLTASNERPIMKPTPLPKLQSTT